jgi:hypothetical protein
MEDKELIILVTYINVAGISRVNAQQNMFDIIATSDVLFEDVNNKNVKRIFLPIIEGQTRVECIYPVSNCKIEGESEIIKLYKALLNSRDEEVKMIATDVERKLKLIRLKKAE